MVTHTAVAPACERLQPLARVQRANIHQTLDVWATQNSPPRPQVFGIDCTGPFGDGIVFKGGEWVPGREYVQRLRVKNVSPKLKKLKYRLPTSKYFSLAYPEVMTLSPGTMQVRFLSQLFFLALEVT